jgi:anti-anti-sigma regulatory factor
VEKGKREATRGSSQGAVLAHELERRNRLLGAITQIYQERLRCPDHAALAKACLGAAEAVTGAAFGWIGELNAKGTLDTTALSDPGWDVCRYPRDKAPKLITNLALRGIWADVIKANGPVLTNDPKSHPASVGVPPEHPPLRSYLGVPLRRAGRVFGVVSVGNKEGGFTPEDVEDLEQLAASIVEVLESKRLEERLARQAEEILTLSTPVLQVWQGIVVAPLIGTLDSARTSRFMEHLLESIVAHRAPVALVDITGVPTIDTGTAQHLVETITAAGLLGAEVILTGLKPGIAQTLVALGVDMSAFQTCAALSTGLKLALRRLGLAVTGKGVGGEEDE